MPADGDVLSPGQNSIGLNALRGSSLLKGQHTLTSMPPVAQKLVRKDWRMTFSIGVARPSYGSVENQDLRTSILTLCTNENLIISYPPKVAFIK